MPASTAPLFGLQLLAGPEGLRAALLDALGTGAAGLGGRGGSPVALRHEPVKLPKHRWAIRRGPLAVSRGSVAAAAAAAALATAALAAHAAARTDWPHWARPATIPAVLLVPAGMAAAFVLHEIGHALAARLAGYRVLYVLFDLALGAVEFDRPSGGVEARHKALISAAGAATNLAACGVCAAAATAAPPGSLPRLVLVAAALCQLSVGAFSLVPLRWGSQENSYPDIGTGA